MECPEGNEYLSGGRITAQQCGSISHGLLRRLARYRANAAALENRAVFEIPEILEQILERSRADAAGGEKALLAGRLG
jgi:hypothetical protein